MFSHGEPMKEGRVFILALAAAIGWGIVVVLMISPPDWLTPDAPPGPPHPPYEPATIQGPPVITMRDLAAGGFDATALESIEPHVHVLNAALVTIVELKEAYESTTHQQTRQRVRGEAVYFHTTADMHEEQIERILPEELRERFHAFVREREAAAGLHQDTTWHQHDDPAHRGVSPGFETPQRHR
jgi:hypothetical protein